MRKLLLAAAAGLLVTPLLASAQDDYGSDVQNQPGMEQGQDPGSIDQQGSLGTEQGSDVRTANPMGSNYDVPAEAQQLFQGKVDTWDVKGTVTSVDPSKNHITIQRKDLPDAELSLADSTKITMDGKQAMLSDIQPGAEVRASFQLAQDTPVAVKLDAKPAKNQGSKGGSGSMGGSGMQH